MDAGTRGIGWRLSLGGSLVHRKITCRQRLRYRFDNLMARGAGAQMLLLAVASLVLVFLTALVVAGLGVAPDGDGGQPSFLRVAWSSLMLAQPRIGIATSRVE